MRVLPLFLALLPVAAGAASADKQAPKSPGASNCPRTTSYFADKADSYRNRRLLPHKLTELPPATAYMAVYRRIGRCEAPLTMSDYRSLRR